MFVASCRCGVHALAERLDELTLTDDPLDSLVVVKNHRDATGDGQHAFGRLLEGVLHPHGHVFVVKREVGHGLSHGSFTMVEGFGSCFLQVS